jgi:hypothetical protein
VGRGYSTEEGSSDWNWDWDDEREELETDDRFLVALGRLVPAGGSGFLIFLCQLYKTSAHA